MDLKKNILLSSRLVVGLGYKALLRVPAHRLQFIPNTELEGTALLASSAKEYHEKMSL